MSCKEKLLNSLANLLANILVTMVTLCTCPDSEVNLL